MENEINNNIKKEEECEDYEENEQNEDSEIHSQSDSSENNYQEFESQLGKKEYWDNFYTKEIKQFKNNSDLIGEVWFGEQVQNKVINYVKEKFSTNKNIKVLDVGCGNASFLIKLCNLRFDNLFGMDYSEKSIELANNILKDKLQHSELETVHLYTEDINNPLQKSLSNDALKDKFFNFDLIHDKGTFDAFMSSKENKHEAYLDYIFSKSNPGSTFIITSCNYSESELKNFFLGEKNNRLQLIANIPHKSFNFGGSQGQVVTTLIFTISSN